MNDVVLPLGERYGVNVVTGVGEMTTTACEQLIARARESGRPARGRHCPVMGARHSLFAAAAMTLPVAALILPIRGAGARRDRAPLPSPSLEFQ